MTRFPIIFQATELVVTNIMYSRIERDLVSIRLAISKTLTLPLKNMIAVDVDDS